MRPSLPVVLLMVMVLVVGTVAAGEIVHFTNGTTMPIRSHEVQDGMIHVDLGSNAIMAFPSAQVDRISRDGADVYLRDGGTPANVTAASRGGNGSGNRSFVSAGAPLTGSGNVPSSARRRAAGDDMMEYGYQARSEGSSGLPVGTMRPVPNHPNPRARRLTVTGNSQIWGDPSMTGSSSTLPQTSNGTMRMPGASGANPGNKAGVEVRRFLPNANVTRAGAAEGKTNEYHPPPVPPADATDDGGSSN